VCGPITGTLGVMRTDEHGSPYVLLVAIVIFLAGLRELLSGDSEPGLAVVFGSALLIGVRWWRGGLW
jgi:hypothetical protein